MLTDIKKRNRKGKYLHLESRLTQRQEERSSGRYGEILKNNIEPKEEI